MSSPKQNIAEQYELGDAASHDAAPEPAVPATPTEPQPAAVSQSASNVPEPPPAHSLPRNPDGTFAPRATEPPQHSSRLIEMAHDFGLSDDEISSLPTPILEKAVHKLYKQQQELFRQHSIQATLQQPPSQPAQIPDGSGVPGGTPEPTPSDLGINEADYDPGLMGVIKKLQAEINTLKAAHQQTAQLSFNEQCDIAFAKHKAHVGEGTRSDLTDDSPFLARRVAILNMVKLMPQKGTLQSRIDKAVETLYGTPAKPDAPAPTAKSSAPRVTEEEWRGGSLQKPTHRKPSDEAPGVAKATRSVAAKLDEMNGSVAQEPESVDDFLG